jgi:hypothetical protein
MRPVDVFLRALAGNAQAVITDMEDEIGEAAEPRDRTDVILEQRDGRHGLARDGDVRHAFSLSILAS